MIGPRFWWVGLFLIFAGCFVDPKEFNSLREQVQLQQRQIVELKARQEERGLKIEKLGDGFKILGDKAEENARRIDELEERSGQTAMPSTPFLPALETLTPLEITEPAQPEELPSEIVVRSAPKAEDLYRSAYDHFSRREYSRAILGFEEFVANHPDHDLADNAQYWIGECYYSQKEFVQAVEEFAKIEKIFPGGNKVVAALLKKGLALKELGRDQEAIVAMEKVVSQFPRTEEAVLAEEKLFRWR